jgi:hypothetical protein
MANEMAPKMNTVLFMPISQQRPAWGTPMMTVDDFIVKHAPWIMELAATPGAPELSCDVAWMDERCASLGCPPIYNAAGARLYHVFLLGWCFLATARE